MRTHPNIVTVFDSGRAGGYFHLVMEYVDGINLRTAIATHALTPADALSVVGRCATPCSTPTRPASCTAT